MFPAGLHVLFFYLPLTCNEPMSYKLCAHRQILILKVKTDSCGQRGLFNAVQCGFANNFNFSKQTSRGRGGAFIIESKKLNEGISFFIFFLYI